MHENAKKHFEKEIQRLLSLIQDYRNKMEYHKKEEEKNSA